MLSIQDIKILDLEQYAGLAEELMGKQVNIIELKRSIEKIIANPDYLLIGIKDEAGRLLGSVMGIICIDTVGECLPFMVLENLIVKEGCRGQGIGKMLVNYVEAKAHEHKCSFIMLLSAAKRKEAHKFYESIGYSQDVSLGFKKYL